ncbi:restriction endonuclease subunit S [uncultured Ruegeria sp.]|uniref:restriction endonuclease subunit S n=1 Tax=uncultured Ruegeria sp. TaxID=259304 RepID=UPI002616B3E3|nr:restriction endonuclease subunit S [uncultured Ruegeria sp.]
MFPDKWDSMPLSAAAKVIDCKHRTPLYADEGYPIVSPGNIQWGEIDLESCRRIEMHELDSMMNHCVVKAGDIVMGRNQSVGIGAYVGENTKFALGQDTILIQPKEIDPRYLYDFTASELFQKQIFRLLGGSTFARINLGDIRNLTIVAPPRPEQRKIAEILSTWDAAIEKTEALLATARTQKRALMQSLLTGKRRFQEFQGQPWQEVRLGEMGKTVSGGTPDSKIAAYWDGDIEWATPTDITKLNSRHIHGTARRISAEGLKKSSAKLVDKGALLICTRATIGDLAIATGPICTNQGFKNLVLFKHYDPDFVFYLLQFHKNELVRYASGSTFLELSKKDFEKRIFNVPALPEQKRIAAVLNDVERQIAHHSQGITKLRTEKKALMQQLLTGKRRVKV